MEYGGKKKSLGEWIAIYLILGLVIYGVIYYFIKMYKPGYQTSQIVAPTVTPVMTETEPRVDPIMIKTDVNKISYITDSKGMTLYVYDKDTLGVSTCSGTCATNWPAFMSTVSSVSESNVSVIINKDGTKQYAWKSKPLYYFAKDINPGDKLGDGVLGVWHIVRPSN